MFDGEADALVAPAFDGEIGIRPGHAAMMTTLGKGTLRVRTGGQERSFLVQGGFLQVVRDKVRILAEHVEGATP